MQYTCQLRVCIDGPEGCQESYNVVIPDVDITDRTLASRPNLLYYYWQKPSSAVELKINSDQMNCDNFKFYWIMNNIREGQLIIQYNIPSTMVQVVVSWSVYVVCMSCVCMCIAIITRTIQCELRGTSETS